MNIEQIVQGLLADLPDVQDSSQLVFIQRRLQAIEDPNDRRLAEALVLLGNRAPRPVMTQKHVIVLIHGIRTHGAWQDKVAAVLQSHPGTVPVIVGFGYFDIFSFWFPVLFRASPIERVEREIRGVIKDNQGALVSVVAHSFGTYIISQILTKRPDLQFHRLLLCGAIVDRTFAWDALRSYPTDGVVNDVGTRDKLPAVAKLVSWGYGSSGTFGFRTHKVKDRYFDFDHSDFFSSEHIERFWVPYLVEGQTIESSWNHSRPSPSWRLSILELLPLKSFVALLLVFGLWKIF